jgi:hypothetical protein
VVASERFSYSSGPPTRYESSAGIERTFCPSCGTALTYQVLAETATIDVAAATLDDQSDFVPDREIWVGYRPYWLPALTGVAQYQEDSGQNESDDP